MPARPSLHCLSGHSWSISVSDSPESVLGIHEEQRHGDQEVHALAVTDARVVDTESQEHVLQIHDLSQEK